MSEEVDKVLAGVALGFLLPFQDIWRQGRDLYPTHTHLSLMKKAVQSVYFDYLEKKEEGKGGARAEMAV